MVNKKASLGLKSDIYFKAFFSQKENEKFLEEFVGSILKENIKIKKVIHDARLEQLSSEDKYGILDLDVELENGENINIEMQLKNLHNIEERATFYGSKKITEQKGIGRDYTGLKRVIIIAILNYSFLPYSEYVNKTVRVLASHREYEVNNQICYYYIELDKFRKQNPDMKDKLNQWLAFIDRERGELLEMAKKENKLVDEADEYYKVLTDDELARELEWRKQMAKIEEYHALKTAREEGLEERKKSTE